MQLVAASIHNGTVILCYSEMKKNYTTHTEAHALGEKFQIGGVTKKDAETDFSRKQR